MSANISRAPLQPRRTLRLLATAAILLTATFAVGIVPGPVRADYTTSNLPSWAIGPFTRYSGNPLLMPQGSGFEGANVFNPGVVIRNGAFQMLYRAQNAQGISQVGYASSTDGHTFARYSGNPVMTPSLSNEVYGLEDPRLYELDGTYYSFYTGYDSHNVYLDEATSPDGIHWTQLGAAETGNKDAAVVTNPEDVPVKINGKYVMYYGQYGTGTFIAYSTDMVHWTPGTPINLGLPAYDNPFELCVAVTDYPTIKNGPLNTGIVLFAARQLKTGGQSFYALTEMELSGADPTVELHQLSDAVMTPAAPYEMVGQSSHTIWMNSISFYQGQWWMYYGGADHTVDLATSALRPKPPAPPPSTPFATSFENGQPLPDWDDAVDTLPGGGGIANVGGNCCGLTGPETSLRQEYAHNGPSALMYSGMAQGQTDDHAYTKVFDLSGSPITVDKNLSLFYDIYPQSNANSAGTNGTCASLDLIFADGSALRNLGAKDQKGNGLTPAQQCGHLTVNQWNAVGSKIGAVVAGKRIVRIDVGYSQPSGSGGYRGYVDNIVLTDLSSPPAIDPTVTSVSPASPAPGDVVTVSGAGFGATRPDSGVYLSDNGQTWGQPGSGVPLTIDSWSDSRISFTLPSPSGAAGRMRLRPGSTATFCLAAGCAMSNGIVSGPTTGDTNQNLPVAGTAILSDYYGATEHVGIAPDADLTCSGQVSRLDSGNATMGNMFDADGAAHSLLHPDAGPALSPGATYTDSASGVSYVWPDVPACAYDNIDTGAATQTILMPPNAGETAGTTTLLGFVGLGAGAPYTGSATVTYADASTSAASVGTGDWCQPAPAGQALVVTAKRTDGVLCHVYQWVDSLVPGKVVSSITLPTTTAIGGDHMRLFSVSLALTSSGVTKTFPWLSWNHPGDITYGMPLTSVQLDASAGAVAGTFSYAANPLGKVLRVGVNQKLTATFTPTGATAAGWVTGSAISTSITVDKSPAKFTYKGAASLRAGVTVALKASLKAGDRKLVGAKVVLGFYGGASCRASTGKLGIARCSLKAPAKPGAAVVTMTYAGTAEYVAASQTAAVRLTK